MFKKRSITLFVTSILTTLGFLVNLLFAMLVSVQDIMDELDYTPGTVEYDETVLGLKYFYILTTVVLFIALALYWVSFATKISGFALAGAIILTVSILLTFLGNFIFVVIPLVLGYISFGMQLAVNKRERLANEMPGSDASSSIDPAMMQF